MGGRCGRALTAKCGCKCNSSFGDADLPELLLQALVELPKAVSPTADVPSLLKIDEFLEQNEDRVNVLFEVLIDTLPCMNPVSKGLIYICCQSGELLLPIVILQKIVHCIERTLSSSHSSHNQRINAMMTLGTFADVYSGMKAEYFLTDAILRKLVQYLHFPNTREDASLTLQAAIVVDMLCLTRKNREIVLASEIPSLLHQLEKKYSRFSDESIVPSSSSENSSLVPTSTTTTSSSSNTSNNSNSKNNSVQHEFSDRHDRKNMLLYCLQIGFCSKWLLDNRIPFAGRKVEVMKATDTVNVIVDVKDATSGLMLAPDGIEVRANDNSFATVRATCAATVGDVWYFEVTLLTGGVMQIGWCTSECTYRLEEGRGIGDDEYSVSYDGCRKLVWHMGEAKESKVKWSAGDILGCFLDHRNHTLRFSVNGMYDPLVVQLPPQMHSELYPAISMMSEQQVIFNFGSMQYRYPPSFSFNHLNNIGHLTTKQRHIIPRLIELNEIKQEMESSDIDQEDEDKLCAVCYASLCEVRHVPCGHAQFCLVCSLRCDTCPLCRVPIEERISLLEEEKNGSNGNSTANNSSSKQPDPP